MKKLIYSKFLPLTILFFISSFSSINSQSLNFKIDSLLSEKFPPSAPGASFLISVHGKITYKKAFGLSNLELETTMTPENVFEIGSMTKQFTAISILMLSEQGKLNLEDSLSKFILDYPKGDEITIHELLTHTSGIKDFTRVKGLASISKNNLKPKELIDFFKNEPMDFQPGTAFKYSNSGYIILGYIIELVSGKSYQDFISQNIFEKLKMNHSFYDSHSKIVIGRASGYQKKGNKYVNSRYISYSIPYASGALMSTVGDLFKWQEAIKNNVLISKKTSEKAFTNYTLKNGNHIDYGYGWHIVTSHKIIRYEHGGSIFGFKSMGVYIPKQDIYVIGLTNCDCNSPTKITKEIADLVLENNGNI